MAIAAAPIIRSAHPRMLLDAGTLARLRNLAAANTPEWQQLKATCDSYIGGTVNYPTQDQYPDRPNLGSGYQGEVYMPVLLDEAMCYQVLKTSAPSAAAPYGAKAVDILMKMSTPYSTASGNQGWDPCTDDGYGIRNYGVGFGLGYDWVYELTTPAQRQQVYTTANAWITAFEAPNGCAGFLYAHPLSNYFAGYFHAKAAIAIGTYGDNPGAPAEWNDWYGNQFAQRVQPYFSANLAGGGWLEGYANYGPPAIRNMNLPMREVQTATGVDLVHAASAPFNFPQDSALYAMHFTWPSRAYFDDRDTNHANGNPDPPVGTTQFGMFQQMLGVLAYWGSPWTAIFHQYLNEVGTATNHHNPSADWLAFLDSTASLPTSPVSTLPPSYLAPGIGAVAARSGWGTNASWMSFRAAPYIENPGQGEEGFDQGSIALVRGNTPLLVNTFGWMVHEPNGSSDENLLYNDLFADFDGTQYNGNREIYNVFYVRHLSGSTVAERFGQAAYTTDDGATTKVAAYEDSGDYVFVQATGLADMYRPFSTGPAVAGWTRQIVFLRSDRFIVYDRTTSGNAAWDQYMAWHFPANPVAGTAPPGENRLDVTYQGQYAGAMTTVLPSNATLATVPLYPTSNPTKVWQVQERPTGTSANQRWLTAFDLSSSAAAVATASAINVTQGNMVGVLLAAGDGNSVVLQSAAAAGTPVAGTIRYSVPAGPAHHLITELAPNTGYSVGVTSSGGSQAISVTPGGAFISSPKGVLDFNVSAGGAATPRIAPPPRENPPMPAYPAGG